MGCEQRMVLTPASSQLQALIHLLVGTRGQCPRLAVDFAYFPKQLRTHPATLSYKSHLMSLVINEQKDGHIDAGL